MVEYVTFRYTFSIRPFMRLHTLAHHFQAHPVRSLCLFQGVLLLLFLGSVYALWRIAPLTGVKLHGNVDTGVDLFGTKDDIVWIASVGPLLVLVNGVLAATIARKERTASLFILSTTIPVLLLLTGAVLYLFLLNRTGI